MVILSYFEHGIESQFTVLSLFYSLLKGKSTIFTDYLVPKTWRCRNNHFMAFQIPFDSVNSIYNVLSGTGMASLTL